MHISRELNLALALSLLAPTVLRAQAQPHRTDHCAAAVCDEGAIYMAAIDSALAELGQMRGRRPMSPRILNTIHLSPFRRDGELSPIVDRLHRTDWPPYRRRWPETQIVDSAAVTQSDGVSLTAGGPLVVLAPVAWLGEDAARVRFAMYPDRINYGSEYFVLLRFEANRWRVVRLERGWQN